MGCQVVTYYKLLQILNKPTMKTTDAMTKEKIQEITDVFCVLHVIVFESPAVPRDRHTPHSATEEAEVWDGPPQQQAAGRTLSL